MSDFFLTLHNNSFFLLWKMEKFKKYFTCKCKILLYMLSIAIFTYKIFPDRWIERYMLNMKMFCFCFLQKMSITRIFLVYISRIFAWYQSMCNEVRLMNIYKYNLRYFLYLCMFFPKLFWNYILLCFFCLHWYSIIFIH